MVHSIETCYSKLQTTPTALPYNPLGHLTSFTRRLLPLSKKPENHPAINKPRFPPPPTKSELLVSNFPIRAMQHGDYSSAPYYQYPPPHQNPNSNPNPVAPSTDLPHHNPYASAPPFSSSDYSPYSQSYPPYSHNPDPAPPTAPSFNPPFNPTPQPPSFPSFESHAPYQPPPPPPTQSYHPSYDQPSYATLPPSIPANSNPTSPFSSSYPGPFSNPAAPPPYEAPSYENLPKFDHGGGGGSYLGDRYGGVYSRSQSDLGSDLYGKRYDSGGSDSYGDGVFAYQGEKVEPYGARGTAPKSSSSSALFDDYGRAISFNSGRESAVSSSKIVRAVPKADTQDDSKSGVLKFRVKLLAESGGQSTMDVLCQIGLDGIRMLDPATSRTLRIYPLETITRCEVTDSSTFAFWSKSTVDIEPRRIRLQSNSYTTNTLLDTVTAATVQLKEMGGSTRPAESLKTELSAERKKGLTDWMNIIKPGNEEKDHWVPDEAVSKCTACGTDFGAFIRRHHCRNCGDIFCDKCTHGRIALTAEENAPQVRVCDRCMAEVTQRLSNAKDASSKPAALHSHEDLAKKLQAEMEKNRRESSGSKSDGSGRRMREVACPTCTVHLQVQVPSSGSETIECGVCQHPFLVSAH
uniref:formin-like protein 16 isoform X2 n=1 Tax=Fragaria vesca subsp. vesca TaxID=101020 RepID=UPI0005CAAFCD|nr:PREDICTED: formin-like protein 16 isoform X2 [Fragaria vesca subsp. vesca]